MKIGVPKETRSGETRVAASPDSVKKLRKKNFEVAVERGAGLAAHYTDEAYAAAGAELVDGTWSYGGEPIRLKFIARVEDERREERAAHGIRLELNRGIGR